MVNKIPQVSIIITNYNYGKYLSRCLRSCLSQKYIDCEVIVVDDVSSDDSDKIIKPFLNDIVYIKNKKNLGVAGSSNVGVENCRGRYFVRVDADDYIQSDMCYMMNYYLEENSNLFGVACDYWMVDNYEEKIERKSSKIDNISCGIMYQKELFMELGGYDETMRHREEENLRKRLGGKYKLGHLEIPFYRYRMHNNNKTKEPEYKTWEI
jgi:glycosyltransferase involved in cell wall biosynthesis